MKRNLILEILAIYAAFTAAFAGPAVPGVYFTVREDAENDQSKFQP